MQAIEYKTLNVILGRVAPWCFAEVFILQGLHDTLFVSAANTWVTDAFLAQNCETRRSRFDSKGLTKRHARFCGGADSKGLAGGKW